MESNTSTSTPKSTNWMAIAAAIGLAGTAVLSGIGAWNALKDAILSDVMNEIADLREDMDRDNARDQLHIACWAQAAMQPAEKHLTTYVYCTKGKISKDAVAK